MWRSMRGGRANRTFRTTGRGLLVILGMVWLLSAAGFCQQEALAWMCPGEEHSDRALVATIQRAYRVYGEPYGRKAGTAILTRALAEHPSNLLLQTLIANFEASSGEREAAVSQVRRIVQEHPEFAAAHVTLGSVSVDPEMRATEYRTALKLQPCLPVANLFMGVARMHENDDEGAETYLRRATTLRPKYFRAHQKLAWCLGYQQRWKEAAQEFRRSLKDAPAEWDTHFGLSVVLAASGDAKNSLRELQMAKDFYPSLDSSGLSVTAVLVALRENDARGAHNRSKLAAITEHY